MATYIDPTPSDELAGVNILVAHHGAGAVVRALVADMIESGSEPLLAGHDRRLVARVVLGHLDTPVPVWSVLGGAL